MQIYYLANDGKEYKELQDAQVYGGGCRGKIVKHDNVLEAVTPLELAAVKTPTAPVAAPVAAPAVVEPVAAPETQPVATGFDAFSDQELKDFIKGKGGKLVGNFGRPKLLSIAQSLQ